MLENELRVCNYWTDLTLPPPNKRVTEVTVKFLNQVIYHLREVSMHLKWAKGKKKRRGSLSSESESSDNEVSDLSISSSEEELSSEDEDEESEEKKKSSKKKDRWEKSPKEPKDKEKSSSEPNVQSNIEDLAEHFKCLKLKLGERGGQMPQPLKT